MPKCVVFSERAFTSILVETQEKIRTETGGVFLGYRKGDVWYVIESIDPGPNSVFQPAYSSYQQGFKIIFSAVRFNWIMASTPWFI